MFDHFLNFLNDYQNILLKLCQETHENDFLIKKSVILIIFWKNFAWGAEKSEIPFSSWYWST